MAVLSELKSTAILLFLSSTAADRCSAMLSTVNALHAGEAER